MRTEETAPAHVWDWPHARERCLREAERYARSPLDAEDIVQEALLRAWRKRGGLRNPEHPMPWLLQITRNEVLRASSRSKRDGERYVLMEEPDCEAASEWTESVDTRIDVRAAMRQLGEEERRLINLRYEEELTHSRIADLMAMPVGTCKVRLHRLRKLLGAMLAQEATP